MDSKVLSRLASLGVACSVLLLGLHGTALALTPIPELDPGTAAGGLTLALGVALLVIERFRRR
jgi:hypothetical protein